MIYHTTTHTDVVESFLLGLSCLVGGDQFYIFISQTEASPKTQSYIAMTAVLSTLFLAIIFYDEYNASLFDLFHVVYLIMLMIWISVLYQKVRDRYITTVYTSILGIVLTFLIILSCIHYSHRKDLLPSFLSGLLFARLLPTFIWTFMKEKKPEYEDNLSTLSMRLALLRILFCLGSLMIKITSGTLDFSRISVGNLKYDLAVIRSHAFTGLWEQFIKSFKDRKGSFNFNNIPLNFFIFFLSIVLYLGLPPILHRFSHLYSHHLCCTIDMMRTFSHLLGVALGTKYPASKTTSSYYFPTIYFGYAVYVFGLGIASNHCKIRSQILLYTIVILTGFILGYVWSYSLFIIINTKINPTCLYEDVQGLKACCGEKIEAQCYCKLDSLIRQSRKSNYKMFDCWKILYYSEMGYSKDGKCAILLIYDTYTSECSKTCQDCQECGNGNCCLKIIGIYKIDAVTVSSCSDCQLTIRLEGTCCCGPGGCESCCPGTECVCEDKNGKCCLCLKCCSRTCETAECKCCIHFCNGTSRCNGCCKKCNNGCEGVRIFICFKSSSGCCIREIKPNLSREFIPDLTIQNQFDIKNIFISDCCHVGLKVDLQCTMKNNFFRLTPINYPKKSIDPISLTLMRNGNECCNPTNQKNCCCKNCDFVKVCVKYDGSEKNCKIECKGNRENCCCGTSDCQCPCKTEGCCSCCITCNLNVDKLSSFYQEIEIIRVKLVLILWFFVLIFLIITVSTASKIKNKSLKYYGFFPIRSFETVNKEVENNNMNSMHTVLQRLRAAQEGIFLETFGEKDKKHDLDHMLQLCKSVLYPSSFKKLKHYVLSQSSMLIASPQYVNRRLDLELVKWSYCVGFVHTYIIMMFFRIQDYFLKWEHVWLREYLNYRKTITSKFNKITQTSKFSISLMCEVDVNHKTIVYLNKTRTGDWGSAYDEIDRYTHLYDKEEELSKSPPYRMDLRLMYFLDRWDHRIESIIFWIHNETNQYDWKGLLNEYPKIRTWFFNFRTHIHKRSIEVNPSVEVLNVGTEILEAKVKA